MAAETGSAMGAVLTNSAVVVPDLSASSPVCLRCAARIAAVWERLVDLIRGESASSPIPNTRKGA